MAADSRGAQLPGATTWLLGAIALWALVVWGLGLSGLGGRIVQLADDPSMLQKLPQLKAPGPERLGTLDSYAEIGARPLFNDDRRPQPFFINPQGEGEDENAFDFVLTSVLLTPGLTMAIIQLSDGSGEERLRIGEGPDSASSWTLASVAKRSVVFNGPEGQRTLELRVFDGVGGQPPTAMSTGSTAGVAGARGAGRPLLMPGRRPLPGAPAGKVAGQDAADAAVPPPPAAAPSQPPAEGSPEAQAEAIRQRIEARRAQLIEQARDAPAPPNTP